MSAALPRDYSNDQSTHLRDRLRVSKLRGDGETWKAATIKERGSACTAEPRHYPRAPRS